MGRKKELPIGDPRRRAGNVATTERLAAMAPDRLLVGESGLYAALDRMALVGLRCFLVGESLMRER